MPKEADRLDEIFAETACLFEEITDLPYVDATGVPTDDADEQPLTILENYIPNTTHWPAKLPTSSTKPAAKERTLT